MYFLFCIEWETFLQVAHGFHCLLRNQSMISSTQQVTPLSQKLREVLPPQRQFHSNCSEFVDVSFSYKTPHDPDHDVHTSDLSLFVLCTLDPVGLQFVIW